MTYYARSIVAVGLAVCFCTVSAVRAETAQEKFYRAYYLEHAQSDLEGAVRLYGEAASQGNLPPPLQGIAKARLASCTEELACSDFAKLMPPETLLYAEIQQPGEQLIALLDQLGLLAGSESAEEQVADRVAVSPSLIKELLGIRGAAVAVTGFDMVKQMPSAVLVFHPGNLEVIRGLIETGLPVGGRAAEAIDGHPTYVIEDMVHVTLTSRLVIVSTHRTHITGVVKRLSGQEKNSLATSDGLAEAMKDRGGAMIFACLNAKPIMPLISGFMAASGGEGREMAMAQAVLDLNSIRTVVVRAGMSHDGMNMEMSVRLDEGHHNLVYNLVRTPPVGMDTFKSIPEGAAGFVVGALNEASTQYVPAKPTTSDGKPIVTGLDFGRELFANVISFAFYALPPEGAEAPVSCVPDVGAVITVNDPSRSEALWGQILGIASLATGAPTIEGTSLDVAGLKVRSFRFPENVTAYFATSGKDVHVALSPSALSRAVAAKRDQRSILRDPAFANSLTSVNSDTTKAVFVHPGRCFEIAKRYLDADELAEAEPFVAAMSNTVASLVLDHSGEQLRVSAAVTGLPKIGGLIAQLISKEREASQGYVKIERAKQSGRWDEGLKSVEDLLAERPGDTELLRAKFELLAGKNEVRAAEACAEELLERMNDDADELNAFAWNLLTEQPYQDRFTELARRISRQSNELTDYANWMYLDTLALAEFKSGDVKRAVELEEKALLLSRESGRSKEVEEALARFRTAMDNPKVAQAEPDNAL